MKAFLIALVRAYKKYLSPLFPPSCIYEPTCSEYALQALEKYGAAKGSWLAFRPCCLYIHTARRNHVGLVC